ncbi:MAG: SAM-dependent chlorinase/fluorinase [bacterium]|nr:SAM-dependent chlorinase/fluorinase [bacterium]
MENSYQRSIVTLTTDFGEADSFVAQMKGILLSVSRGPLAVESLTQQISPFNTAGARRFLSQVARFYPDRTIHLAVIDPGVGSNRRGLIIRARLDNPHTGAVSAYFVGPDNGIFSDFLNPEQLQGVWEIDMESNVLACSCSGNELCRSFDGREVFAPVAAHLASGVSPDMLGRKIAAEQLVCLPQIEEVIVDSVIDEVGLSAGVITAGDCYGNMETNYLVAKNGLKKIQDDFVLETLSGQQLCYAESFFAVPPGDAAYHLGCNGYLEIFVNCGNAREQLNIKVGDEIRLLRK